MSETTPKTKAQIGVQALLAAGDELTGKQLADAMGVGSKYVSYWLQPAIDLHLLHRRPRYRPEAEGTGDDSRMAYSVPVARKPAAREFVDTPRRGGPQPAAETAPAAQEAPPKPPASAAVERLDPAAFETAMREMGEAAADVYDTALSSITGKRARPERNVPAAPATSAPARPTGTPSHPSKPQEVTEIPRLSITADGEVTMNLAGVVRLDAAAVRELGAFLIATRAVWDADARP